MKPFTSLAVTLLLLASVFASTPSRTRNQQRAFDPSSMSLDQSAGWLRKTLLDVGKKRLAISATYVCDLSTTGVSLDKGILTIDISQTCAEESERYTQNLTREIMLADVDTGKFRVVEVEDHQHTKGFGVDIVMVAGKKSKTRQVLIENGKTTRKMFEHGKQEVYLDNREKANQEVAVLRRMVTLSSPKMSGKQ